MVAHKYRPVTWVGKAYGNATTRKKPILPSKIGRQPIDLPETVKFEQKGPWVQVTGPKGSLFKRFHDKVTVHKVDQRLIVTMNEQSKKAKAHHGFTRSTLAHMVKGVTQGHEKILRLVGIGFRASLEDNKKTLSLALGFCDLKKVEIPDDIDVLLAGTTTIILFGCDKMRVGQLAARIRVIRKPEPYKGKGIRYDNEEVKIKTPAAKK